MCDGNGGHDEGDEHDQLQQQEEARGDTGEGEEHGTKPGSQQAEFVSGDVFSGTSRHRHGTLVPYGLPCVRELLRFLVSIINMRERYILNQACDNIGPYIQVRPQYAVYSAHVHAHAQGYK